jgi:predicted heme/steroid binding protein
MVGTNPHGMKEFTKEELSKYNGKGGMPVYIAHQGKVYDVTSSSLWESGEHQGMHACGEDLTDELADAPHDVEVLERFPVVGTVKG